ncbi:MAG: hypothetical protein Q9162_004979 [Coniocarpon cinnabarinum]
MFWRFGGYANISSLDSILDKSDVTLEELLDESDLIQELKAQNAKLVEFLREEKNLESLLKYALSDKNPQAASEEKEDDDDTKSGGGFFKNRKFRSRSRGLSESEDDKLEAKKAKYAYVSCEILSSEVYSIYESLLALPDLLRDFWTFIERPVPLNAVQASYFTKINEALLEKKADDMITFIKTKDNVVPDMMRHVDCPVIMDLLLKLISLEKEPEGHGVVDWLHEQHLMPMLLSYITPAYPPSTQTSAGDFLKAVITISANAQGQDASVIGPNELTRQLVSETCVSRLIDEMLRGGNPLTVGVGIIIEVIRKNNSDYDTEGVGPDPKTSDPIYLGTLLRLFSDHIADFMNLILSPKHTVMTENGTTTIVRKDLTVAWGDRIEPLGFDRFKTCELMAELLHCSNMGLLNERGSEKMIKARDAERERLKAEGKLKSSAAKPPQGDFSTSVDSSEFHHAEAFTPLGESPENVKRLEVQNSNGEEEEFEKVAISDAIESEPTPSDGTEQTSQKGESANAESRETTDQLASLKIDEDPESAQATAVSHPPRTSSKPPVSLLTQQLQAAQEESALSKQAGLTQTNNPSDTPLPLFANRSKNTDEGQGDLASNTQDRDAQERRPKSRSADEHGESDAGEIQQDEPLDPQQLPILETEEDGRPVVGDLLKMKFVDNHVVPTILNFFFRFPWNNFLHNVVYDVVQQVFNGSMDRGFNRNLAIDLFETGRIIDRVIEGQERSDHMQALRRMRLGYMGHLTLIAEEIVKFTERQPAELLAPIVVSQVTSSGWIHYVEHTLEETRQKDNAVLGGIRPDVAGGPRQAVLNTINSGTGSLNSPGSAALANAGLASGNSEGLDGLDGNNYTLASGSLLSGFGSSDDEDEDELDDADATDVVAMPSDERGQRGPINDEEQVGELSFEDVEMSDH